MIKKLITRPIAATMSVIAIMVMSLVAMGYLPVSLMPAINIPQITVQVAAPGMSVREIDNVLLKPLKESVVAGGTTEKYNCRSSRRYRNYLYGF